jgi:hypothetical protein
VWASSSLATITITVESPRHHILLFALLHQSSPLRCVRQEGIIISNVLPDRRMTALMLVGTRVALAGTKCIAKLSSGPAGRDTIILSSFFHHTFISITDATGGDIKG